MVSAVVTLVRLKRQVLNPAREPFTAARAAYLRCARDQKLKRLTGGLIIDMDDTLNNQPLFADSRP